jgi:hypothetical protein
MDLAPAANLLPLEDRQLTFENRKPPQFCLFPNAPRGVISL